MTISKKITAFIVASMFLLNINSLNIEAEEIKYSSDNLFKTQDNITLRNVEIKPNNMFFNSICVQNIDDIYGECIFNIPNIQKVNVVFYNEFSTTAFKDKNSSNYILGYSQHNERFIVKYLPENTLLEELNGGLFIKHSKVWYQLSNIDDLEQCIFQTLDPEQNQWLSTHQNDLIDYGVNIYTSCDGKNFKKSNVDLFIEKISQTVPTAVADFSISCSTYKETITLNNLPRNTQYIKIQINEPKLLIEHLSSNLTFISDITFTVNKDDDEQSNNDDSFLDILEKSNNTPPSYIHFGCSGFINKGKSKRKGDKHSHLINNEDYEILDTLGNSSNYMSDNMFIGYSDSNGKQRNITKIYKPIKSRKPTQKRKIIYNEEDSDKFKKPKFKRSKVTKMNSANDPNEDNNIKPSYGDMDYQSSGFVFDDENLNCEHMKKTKSKIKKDIDPSIKKVKIKNTSPKYNIVKSDEDSLDQLENINDESLQSDESLQAIEEYLKTDKKESDLDKNVEEKKVSKIYLSGLCLILSYLLAYNKIGLLQKLFKL